MGSDLGERLLDAKRSLDDRLPGPVRLGLLTLYLHTDRGIDRVDHIAEWDGWDRYHDLGIAALLALQAAVLGLFGLAAWVALTSSMGPTAANDPANAIAIPGVNDFMPLAAGIYVALGLTIATAIHELGHAVACRREGVAIDEWGVALLFGFLPIAGYVLPDEQDLEAASDLARMRVFSVGVFNNTWLALLAGVGLLLPVTASPAEAYMTYFGWALTGAAPPTGAAIAALGPVSNLLFWTAFLSANVALMNALPIGILDGGRVLKLLLGRLTDHVSLSRRTTTVAVRFVGVCTVFLVVAAVFGPHLR